MKNLKDMLNESRRDDKVIEKKAEEIANNHEKPLYDIYGEYDSYDACYDSAMEMAEWMKSYMIENSCLWLEENARDYTYDDYDNTAYIHKQEFIKDFKEAMLK